MKYKSEIYRRKSNRLNNYDYKSSRAYFITICTQNREQFLGSIIDNRIFLSKKGNIVREKWLEIKGHFREIRLDDFVIMPNHLHGILIIQKNVNPEISLKGEYHKPSPSLTGKIIPELGKIVAFFKYTSTKEVNMIDSTPGLKLWQRNYFDHIIRDDIDLQRLKKYIKFNPLNWKEDEYNSP